MPRRDALLLPLATTAAAIAVAWGPGASVGAEDAPLAPAASATAATTAPPAADVTPAGTGVVAVTKSLYDLLDADGGHPRIEGLGALEMAEGGVVRSLRGFVARDAEQVLVGDALRYQLSSGEAYATGHVVYRRPGLRLSAARLGLRWRTREGEAWEVEARATYGDRTAVITADRVEFHGRTLTFYGVHLSLGNGAALAFDAPKAHLYLRDPKPGEDPREERSHVEGVALVSPTGSVVHVPVIWFPYLYRDFSRRYPWTRVRGGYTKRLGTYGRFWIGTGLPEIAGWRTTIDGRVDRHSRAGNGLGSTFTWEHQDWGKGFAEGYLMPSERIRSGEGEELAVRKASALDVEHRLDLGKGAVYGRWTEGPPPDPKDPADPADEPSSLRFLSDYMWAGPDRRPLPRHGAALAYQLPFVTVVGDTDRNWNPNQPDTERWLGLQATATPQQLLGPIHVGGRGWLEDLHRRDADTEAKRVTWNGYLTLGQWIAPGVGFDADVGDQGLGYLDGFIAGTEQDDAVRNAPYTDAGLKFRLEKTYGAYLHSLIPRVGIQLIGPGHGDDLPETPAGNSAYGFGDPRDELEEDARYWVTQLDTRLSKTASIFHAGVIARWAMREQERWYTDDSGTAQLGPHQLVDVKGKADGQPLPGVTFTMDFTYDARPRQWTFLDGTAAWKAASWLRLADTSTYLPPATGKPGIWAHTPGASIYSGRYDIEPSLTVRPGGAPVDSWLIYLTRHMVDGNLFIGYEFVRDANGGVSDRRVSVGFSLVGVDTEGEDFNGPRTSISR